MLSVNLINCRDTINKLQSNQHWDKVKECDLKSALESIALSTQCNLPHNLLNIGTQSSAGPDFQSSVDRVPNSGVMKTLIAPTHFMSNDYLAWDLGFTLKLGIYAGSFSETLISEADAYLYADKFVNQFMNEDGAK